MNCAFGVRKQSIEKPAAQATSQVSWKAAVERSNAAVAAKDWKSARPLLEQSLRVLHGNPRALYRLAMVEAQLGERASALTHLRHYSEMGLVAPKALGEDFKKYADDPEFLAAQKRLALNETSISSASVAFKLDDAGIAPEDIAFDPATRRFLLTSNRERKVVTVDAHGDASDFAPRSTGLWAAMGIAVDATRRRVWVSTSATEEMPGASEAEQGKTAVLEYDADTGRVIQRWELPPNGSSTQLIGDIALAPNGDLIAGDSYGMLYRFKHGLSAAEPLAARDALASAQEPAVTNDGRFAIVADYVLGLARVNLRTGKLSWIEAQSESIALNGIDGIALDGKRAIAVQNGVDPERIISLEFDSAYTRVLKATVLEQRTPSLHEPTHGVMVGGFYYFIANSEGSKLDKGGATKDGETLQPATIMKIALH
jgi:hypothetical protein